MKAEHYRNGSASSLVERVERVERAKPAEVGTKEATIKVDSSLSDSVNSGSEERTIGCFSGDRHFASGHLREPIRRDISASILAH